MLKVNNVTLHPYLAPEDKLVLEQGTQNALNVELRLNQTPSDGYHAHLKWSPSANGREQCLK